MTDFDTEQVAGIGRHAVVVFLEDNLTVTQDDETVILFRRIITTAFDTTSQRVLQKRTGLLVHLEAGSGYPGKYNTVAS